MAFKYGTTSPTAIKYNGTDLTVLKYGTTAVWGKPYSLSISAGSNTSVTVNRTSSPNQRASTGILSSGSVVYYGDVLTITASASSGYTLSKFTVNGTSWTSGNTITVTSAVNVVTGATASQSWHTVFSGSKVDTTVSYSASGTISGLGIINSSYPTRITGNVYFLGSGIDHQTVSFSAVTLPYTVYDPIVQQAYVAFSINGTNIAYSKAVYNSMFSIHPNQITITKVEQYY